MLLIVSARLLFCVYKRETNYMYDLIFVFKSIYDQMWKSVFVSNRILIF